MRVSGVAARRYARALLDVALERRQPAEVRRELEEAAALVEAHKGLEGVLTHPAVAAERKKAILAAIWGERASPLVRRLLELLVERNRMGLLPAIARAYASLWNAHRGVVSAEAVSAVALSAEERDALGGAVRRATGREVELETAVDPAVIGGVLLKMSGWVYDGTVRGRLRDLRERLMGGSPAA